MVVEILNTTRSMLREPAKPAAVPAVPARLCAKIVPPCSATSAATRMIEFMAISLENSNAFSGRIPPIEVVTKRNVIYEYRLYFPGALLRLVSLICHCDDDQGST